MGSSHDHYILSTTEKFKVSVRGEDTPPFFNGLRLCVHAETHASQYIIFHNEVMIQGSPGVNDHRYQQQDPHDTVGVTEEFGQRRIFVE